MRRAQADAQAFGAGYGAVEVFDEDIVVARALHLGEADFLLPAPHRVYIDKLGILLVEAACDDLRKSVCRVKARQAGYAELHRTAVQGDIVAHGGILDGAGIDDIAEPSAFHEAGYLIALGCVCHRCYLNAELRYRVCGAARGIQAQAEVIQPLCKRYDLLIVVILNAYQHAVGASSVHLRHGEARRGQSLEQSLGHGLAYAQHLARRLHLRPEDGVCIPKLFK